MFVWYSQRRSCTVLGGILQRACLASGLCLLVLRQSNVMLVLLLTELSAGKKGKSENLLPECSECFYMHSWSISEPCVQGGTFYYTHTHMWEFDVIFVDSRPKFGLALTLGFIFILECISVAKRSYWTDGSVRQCTGQAVWTSEEPRQICLWKRSLRRGYGDEDITKMWLSALPVLLFSWVELLYVQFERQHFCCGVSETLRQKYFHI